MRNKKGIILAIVSACSFSLGGLLIKLIPFASLSIASGRCIFSTIIIGSYLLITKQKVRITIPSLIGGILVFLNMYTFIIANKLTTAANTIIFEYTAPIYIILFGLLFQKKKINKLDLIVVILVLCGMVFVLADGLSAGNMLGNLIAMLNAVIYAGVFLINEFGGDSTSSMFLGQVITLIVGLPSLLGEKVTDPNVLIYVALIGIFTAGIGYLCLSLSVKYIDPLRVSLIECIEPVLSPILVMTFYGEKLSIYTIIGIFIVLGTTVAYNLIKIKKQEAI